LALLNVLRYAQSMKRIWGHLIAGVGVAIGVSGLTAACAHDDSTIFIRDVLTPPTAQAGGLCQYTADPSQSSITSGILDVAFATSYTAAFLVGNQMTPRSVNDQTRTETSRVTLQGAIVRVTDINGNELRPSFTWSASTTVDPATGGTPSYAPFFAEIVDSTVAAQLKGQAQAAVAAHQAIGTTRVLTYTKVFGHTLGGTRVESNEFQFPVDVCYGCLVTFPSGVSSPLFPQPNCANQTQGGGATSQPCIMGQDQLVDCRLCSATNPDVCGGGFSTATDAGPG
jgi:hypothetical protein